MVEGGALAVRTGVHTGRSPNDKFFVEDGQTKSRIDWGKTNKPISPERYRALYNRMLSYAQRRDLFVRDCWAGADPAHRIGVRVINETAWHNLFARNMFLRPKPDELLGFKPDFTILNLPGFQAEPAVDGTASDCAVLVNFTDRVVAICGTWYAGEIKKSVFTILNYLLPDKNVLPMHASANIGAKGDVAIFLASQAPGRPRCRPIRRHPDRRRRARLGREQPLQLRGRLLRQGHQTFARSGARNLRHHRALRHGAGERRSRSGVRPARPRRRPAHREHARLLSAGLHSQRLDLGHGRHAGEHRHADGRRFRRAAADLASVAGAGDVPLSLRLHRARRRHGKGRDRAAGHLLDLLRRAVHASPPHRLRQDAGREDGPSTCEVLAGQHRLVGRRLRRRRAHVDPAYPRHGAGGARRTLATVASAADPHFGMQVPNTCPDVPGEVLNPKNTWKDKKAYESAARDVAKRFEANFQQFESHVDGKVNQAAIRAAA